MLALTRPWARRAPAWLLLFPGWVGTGLLFQVTVAAVVGALASRAGAGADGTDYGGFDPWVFTLVYASFAGQGVALAIAFACYVRARWSQLLRAPSGEVLAAGTAAVTPSWPQRHLTQLAQLVAGLAVAIAAVCTYWAVGGSGGLPDSQQPSAAMQVARIVGALVAAAGLLAVAGRWGRRRALGLPTALVWLGSGALVAFDGLALVANHLLLAADASPAWPPHDSVIVGKTLVGALAAAVGVLAVTAAARHGAGGTGVAVARAGFR